DGARHRRQLLLRAGHRLHGRGGRIRRRRHVGRGGQSSDRGRRGGGRPPPLGAPLGLPAGGGRRRRRRPPPPPLPPPPPGGGPRPRSNRSGLAAEPTEDRERVRRRYFLRHLAARLDFDGRVGGRLRAQPLGERARVVLVLGADEQVVPALDDAQALVLELVREL